MLVCFCSTVGLKLHSEQEEEGSDLDEGMVSVPRKQNILRSHWADWWHMPSSC
jgi:hypothetical protein